MFGDQHYGTSHGYHSAGRYGDSQPAIRVVTEAINMAEHSLAAAPATDTNATARVVSRWRVNSRSAAIYCTQRPKDAEPEAASGRESGTGGQCGVGSRGTVLV
ncbi:hypothetical protein ABZ738_30135 [Micromonospora sp. NPDC047793]|uniref:hypothetical protein n=1 Tax=Micromonospora sp. NPDC047793 TaxID=3154342 RepID=UPI0033F732AB